MARSRGRMLTRILGYGILVLVLLAAIAINFTVGWRPFFGARKRALTSRKFEVTPARIRRGEYLARGVSGCFDCHSNHDLKTSPPTVISQDGAGQVLDDEPNFRLVAANITPDPETGIGKWSDDAIARAIREGIKADGRAIFPDMPYDHFRYMSDEDLASVVVFIRSLAPVHNVLPPAQIPFVLSRFIQAVPHPVTDAVPEPDTSTPAKRGAYLVKMAHCTGCHTPLDKNFQPIPGMEMAGGQPMGNGNDNVVSANITPDATGIGYYDEALFIRAMRTGFVGARQLKFPMPWWTFRNMTDDDLKAVFAYLRTLTPVHHPVDNSEAATMCRRCGHKHGLGDRN